MHVDEGIKEKILRKFLILLDFYVDLAIIYRLFFNLIQYSMEIRINKIKIAGSAMKMHR